MSVHSDESRTLASLGVRSLEQQALRQYLTELSRLLELENSTLPSREHPVVARLLVGIHSSDPVDVLDHRLYADPKVITTLRARMSRTAARLHSPQPLTTAQSTDLAVCLVLVRVYISWRLGVIDSANKEESMCSVLAAGDRMEKNAASVWLWCGLALARLVGEAEEDDLDFGL